MDTNCLLATVEAGIYGPELNQKLKSFGVTLRHFPQSWEFSTVGGWVATLSGGTFRFCNERLERRVKSEGKGDGEG